MELHVAPLFLGGGERLFDDLGGLIVKLEQVQAIEGDSVTHLKYRVSKTAAKR
jgi:hypothetical protein